MFTALALMQYVTSNTHNAHWSPLNLEFGDISSYGFLPISHYLSKVLVQNSTFFSFWRLASLLITKR